MLRSTHPCSKASVLGLGIAGALSLASSLTPAFAAYGHCSEQPDAADCRTYNMPGLPPAKATGAQPSNPNVHARNHHHMLPQNA
jgi:hypothetical protein